MGLVIIFDCEIVIVFISDLIIVFGIWCNLCFVVNK